MQPTKKEWLSIYDVYKQGLLYLKGRKEGVIKSVRTPWQSFNDASMNGLEWNTITVIAGRPGSGKTLISDQIIRESFDLNPDQHFAVLDCQWEMLPRSMAIRELSGALKMNMKALNSAEQPLGDDVFEQAKRYCARKKELPIFMVDTPRTVPVFERLVEAFCEQHPDKKVIVRVDHSVLVRKDPSEKDKFDTLHNLGEALTRMKKRLPVLFLILSQLNRSPELSERLKEGTHGNYLFDSDLYGADALLQHTDILVMINRPAKYNLKYYGPEQFEVHPNLLAFHFNKVRNGDPRLIFFHAEFEYMRVRDYPAGFLPPRKQSRFQSIKSVS
jgi:replicative DNA helicase